jgi:hypothetical protein
VTATPAQAGAKPAPPSTHVAAQRLAVAASAAHSRTAIAQRAALPTPAPTASSSAVIFAEGPAAPQGVQRQIRFAPMPGAAPPTVTGGSETVVRRTMTDAGSPPATNGSVPPSIREELSTSAVLDRVDEMMSQLEERILEELERRGGRFMGYF